MLSLNNELTHLVADLNPEAAKFLKAARNKEAYAVAVKRVCGANSAMADFIFEHTNAFYIRTDDTPRKGPDKDKPYRVCEIYLDDPVVSSEVNMRREMLQLQLGYAGMHFDELRIVRSKLGMRNRHPFAVYSSRHPEHNAALGASANAGSPMTADRRSVRDKLDDLETVKRALCLVFSERADDAVAAINVAALELVLFDDAADRRKGDRWFWLHLYIEDDFWRKVFSDYGPAIATNAKRLGLKIRSVQVHPAAGKMCGLRAFPVAGAPVLHGQ